MNKFPSKSLFKNFTARTQNTFHGRLENKILFLHVPKCGGTSIREALKSCYTTWDLNSQSRSFILNAASSFQAAQKAYVQDLPANTANDYPILKLRENLLLYYMHQDTVDFIAGHFAFSEVAYQNFSDTYSFITILRDPIDRWLSSYFFNAFKKREHRKVNLNIEEYLKSDFARSQGYEYVKFLGGISKTLTYDSEQAMNQAKENLKKFCLVGFLEKMNGFTQDFEGIFGRSLKIETLNRSPKPSGFRDSLITEEIQAKIQEICKPDIELYRYATEYFLPKS